MVNMKLREDVVMELATTEICRLLTEAVCDQFGMFRDLEVWRVTPTGHSKWRVELAPKQKPLKIVQPPTKQGKAA